MEIRRGRANSLIDPLAVVNSAAGERCYL